MKSLKLPKKNKLFIKVFYFIILLLPSVLFILSILMKDVSGLENGYVASNQYGQRDFETNVADNILATAISLMNPSDVELDSAGNRLFVYDDGNDRILIYGLNDDDSLVDSEADYVLGQTSLEDTITCGVQGVTDASLCGGGLTFDSNSQTLFASDYERNRILLFDVTTIVNGESAFGVIGQGDFADNAAASPPTQASLSQASMMDYDSVNDRLFVADYMNSRVLTMDFNKGTFVNGQNFDIVLGRADFVTGGACGAVSATSLCNPSGLNYNSTTEDLFVVDSNYNRVLIFDASVLNLSNTDSAVNVLGQSDFTSSSDYGGMTMSSGKGFSFPSNVEFDETSNLAFISDADSRIYVFDISTIVDFETAVNILGQSSFSSLECESIISSGITCNVSGMAFSESNNVLYVNDGLRSRILGFDTATISDGEAANQLIGQASYTVGFGNYFENPHSAGMEQPYDIEFDHINNRLYTIDYNNDRILIHNTNSEGIPIDNIADYVLGADDFASVNDGCEPLPDTFCYPESISLDLEGQRLFVADTVNNRVLVFDVSSENLANGISPDYVLGQEDFVSSGVGNTASTMQFPGGIAYSSSSDYLYVSDMDNNRVLGFDLSGGITNGMDATRVLGQANFTDNDSNRGGSMDINTLFSPTGLALDESRKYLFVSDKGNGRILVYDISEENFINGDDAHRVIGSITFVYSDYDLFTNVREISFDPLSKLLFTVDYSQNRVLVFDVGSINNGESPSAVVGQTDFVFNDCNQDLGNNSSFSYNLCSPLGVSVNYENGNVYVADTFNHRVLIYKFAQITQSSFANGESGVLYNQALTVANDQGTPEISLYSGTLPPGLSVAGSSITGTPTTTGTYNFTLEVSDDNGSNGIFRQLQEFTILIDPDLIDTDGDGTTDVIEQASPNSGDANNDSTDDDQQDNVTSIINPITNNYVTVESNCNANDNVDVDPNTGDTAFSYPYGMTEFTVTCTNPGDSANVKLFFYEPEDASSYILRKFDGTDYDTVGDYVIQESTVGGESVTIVTYNIIDGGVLDQDGIANGTIVDPVGLAENSVGTPNTGLGGASKK